jgi:pimeloyl-ACP methyl ester carboxylesterase
MGGAICQHLGLHQPDRVGGLGLIGTGARLRVLPAILENSASPVTFPRAVDEIVRRSYSASAAPHLLELARERMLAVRPTVLHSDFLACDHFDILAEVENIRVPAVVITGTDDQLTPPRYAQYLANKLPEARLLLIPQAGHMVMLEQPRQVASGMLDFLTRLN